jgi:HAD superfamily hydrolase (TIGR01544 family)
MVTILTPAPYPTTLSATTMARTPPADIAQSLLKSLLSNPNTIISPSKTSSILQKLTNLIERGPVHLNVTADFDRTLSTSTSLSSHGLLEAACGSETFRQKTVSVSSKYLPIERDPSMSIADKLPLMKEWYQTNHALMVDEGITSAEMVEAVATCSGDSSFSFRPGFSEMYNLTDEHGIPLLIFSAGLANIIKHCVLHHLQEPALSRTCSIVSNTMIFHSESKKLIGFEGELIHMFNKDQSQFTASSSSSSSSSSSTHLRENAILLGDGPGDATMCNNNPFHEFKNVLKIGYLNFDVPKNKDNYLSIFDIVICGSEGDFGGVQSILEAAIQYHKQEEDEVIVVPLELVSDTM